MKCPVCKLELGGYTGANSAGGKEYKGYPLYQRTYVVDPQDGIITCHTFEDGEKPISPRCSKCYDKAERKLLKKG